MGKVIWDINKYVPCLALTSVNLNIGFMVTQDALVSSISDVRCEIYLVCHSLIITSVALILAEVTKC